MKVLDVSSLHEGIRGMTQQLSQLEKQLNGVENSIRSFVTSKDSFRGKGANAIRRFYEYAHLPFLKFFQSFLTSFQSKLQQLQFEMDGLEGDSRGFIDESYLTSELEDGLNQINKMVAELTGETNAQLSRVSDIVHLPPLQDHQFHEGIQHAKQSARQTVDNLHQFDHQQTQSFTALVEDLSLIKRYIEEMNQQFESGKINVKSFSPVMLQNLEAYGQLQTRLYNQTVMERWNSQHYPELGVFYSVGHAASFDQWANPSCARPEPKGVVESGVDFTKGLLKGGFAVVKETVEFAERVLTEPEEVLIETIDFVAAVKDDPKILLEIGQSLLDSFNDQVIYGTAETRGEWFGYALATVAGGKGITSISKIAKAGKLGKLGGGPGRQMQHKVQLMIESQKAKLKDFSTSVKGTIKTQQAAIKGTAIALKAKGINKVRELMKDFLPHNNQSQVALAGGPYNTIDSANINRKLEDNKKDIINRIEVEAGKNNKIDIDLIKKYIRDIEGRTGRDLPKNQIENLKEALRSKEYNKMSPIQTAKHRAEFDKIKNKIIKEWEGNTGQKWPVYNEDVISEKTGKIIRKKGDKYDAHHIIENTFGGEHEWWNIHPAKFPNEHQAGIHGTGSPANTLFKGR